MRATKILAGSTAIASLMPLIAMKKDRPLKGASQFRMYNITINYPETEYLMSRIKAWGETA